MDFSRYFNLVLQTREGQVELWQLVRNPFYWDKTTHGLTPATPRQDASIRRASRRSLVS